MTILIILESIVVIVFLLGSCFWFYQQNQKNKMAITALLTHLERDKDAKNKQIGDFFKTKLLYTEENAKKLLLQLFEQEIILLQEIAKIPTISKTQLLNIYSKLQALLQVYYISDEKLVAHNTKQGPSQEELLSNCQAKFIQHLEKRCLITVEIRNQIHSLDASKTNNN